MIIGQRKKLNETSTLKIKNYLFWMWEIRTCQKWFPYTSKKKWLQWQDEQNVKKKGIRGKTRQWSKFIFKWRTNTSIFDEVSSEKTSYDELHNIFNDLYDKCLKLSRLFTKQKKIISSLESKSKDMQDEIDKYKLDIPRSCLTCNKCAFIESKI